MWKEKWWNRTLWTYRVEARVNDFTLDLVRGIDDERPIVVAILVSATALNVRGGKGDLLRGGLPPRERRGTRCAKQLAASRCEWQGERRATQYPEVSLEVRVGGVERINLRSRFLRQACARRPEVSDGA